MNTYHSSYQAWLRAQIEPDDIIKRGNHKRYKETAQQGVNKSINYLKETFGTEGMKNRAEELENKKNNYHD